MTTQQNTITFCLKIVNNTLSQKPHAKQWWLRSNNKNVNYRFCEVVLSQDCWYDELLSPFPTTKRLFDLVLIQFVVEDYKLFHPVYKNIYCKIQSQISIYYYLIEVIKIINIDHLNFFGFNIQTGHIHLFPQSWSLRLNTSWYEPAHNIRL